MPTITINDTPHISTTNIPRQHTRSDPAVRNLRCTQFFSDNPYPSHQFATKSIGQIFSEYKSGDIVIHSCQRNFVWTPKLKQKFLTTISKLGPISGPQFNQNGNSISEIMDGQNRIKTIVQFMMDEIMFENEHGIKIKYSQMSDDKQRAFRNIRVGFTETSEWTAEQCEENFCEIQEGLPLTAGEIINSSTTNPLTVAAKEITENLENFVTDSPKDCGMKSSLGNMKRYKNLEIFGTLIDMVMNDKFPQKSGKTSLDIYDSFKPGGDGDTGILVEVKIEVLSILEAYKYLVESVDELQKGACKDEHWESAIGEAHMFRSIYFIFKKGIYKREITDEVVMKFKNMIVMTHFKRTPEEVQRWDDIKMWAQNDISRIYDKYLEYYV